MASSAAGFSLGLGLVLAGLAGPSGAYAGLAPGVPALPPLLPKVLPSPQPPPTSPPPAGAVIPPTVIGGTAPAPLPVSGFTPAAAQQGPRRTSQPFSSSGGGSSAGPARSDRRFARDDRDEAAERHQAQVQQQQDAQILAELPALEAKYQALALAAGGGSGRFGSPLMVDRQHPVPITQPFGCSVLVGEPYDAACETKHLHTGIDLAAPFQSPVFAPDAGVATVVHGTAGYGNYVLITNGNGYQTLLAHLDRTLVSNGDVVHRGDVVGLEGSTGYSSGPHVHFEIRFQGAFVDPCAELDCGGGPGPSAELLSARQPAGGTSGSEAGTSANQSRRIRGAD